MLKKVAPFFTIHAATAFVVGGGVVGVLFYGIYMGAEIRLEIKGLQDIIFETKPKPCQDAALRQFHDKLSDC